MDLNTAEILYLDDAKGFLNSTKEFFKEEGIDVKTTTSVQFVRETISSRKVDVLICDLYLKETGEQLKGSDILRFIRSHDNDIFLGLYTAYKRDLGKEELQLLKNLNIKVYEKGDDKYFAIKLENDYNSFLNDRVTHKKDADIEYSESSFSKVAFFEKIKKLCISYLNEIQNKKMLVPISLKRNMSIEQLLVHLDLEDDIGINYMHNWLDTLVIIQKIRKNEK